MTAVAERVEAVYLGKVIPGSPEWLPLMSASKIAAVLGLSQYESRFSLWHRMAGLAAPDPDNDIRRRGHYLEPALRAWFRDQHPDWDVQETGTWLHGERDWQAATPDGLVFPPDGPTAALECKTAAYFEDWGTPGTDEIPVGYRAQVIWQMDTLGLDTAYISVLNDRLQFLEYVVHYDADEASFMRKAAREFLDSLPGGPAEQRPDIDQHSATYAVVKALPEGLIDEPVEIDPLLAERYRAAVAGFKAAEDEKRECTSRVLDAIGNRKHADCLTERIATRAVKKDTGATHSLTPARGLLKEAS
jgi:putative phage-type endonuclease